MDKEIKDHQKFLEEQSKEQLIIFLKNHELIEKNLRDKLELLSGCSYFGDQDGTNGSCVDCCYDNPTLHTRCCVFQEALKRYRDRIKD